MSGKNTIVRSISPKTVLPHMGAGINSSTSLKQGDLVCLLSALVAVAAAEADGASFLGVMPQTIVSGKIPSPYSTDVDASRAADELSGPIYGVTAKCVLKAGDSLAFGDVVYLNPGVQTLSGLSNGVQAAGTKAVGVYSGAAVTAAAGGTEIEVLLGARAAGDVLKF